MESIAAEEKLIGESTSKFLNIWDSAATESHCVTGTLCFYSILANPRFSFLFFLSSIAGVVLHPWGLVVPLPHLFGCRPGWSR